MCLQRRVSRELSWVMSSPRESLCSWKLPTTFNTPSTSVTFTLNSSPIAFLASSKRASRCGDGGGCGSGSDVCGGCGGCGNGGGGGDSGGDVCGGCGSGGGDDGGSCGSGGGESVCDDTKNNK